MKTYIKFLINIFFNSFWKIFFLFFGIILITGILEEIEFFKDIDKHFLYPIFLSLLNTPSVIFEILPFIFLISTQFFFIKLIDNHELEIFKYSGLTNIRIIKIISLFTFILGILIIFFYYNFSSLLQSKYLKIKNSYSQDNKYLAVINDNGLWIKDSINDKINIINASKVSDQFLIDVLIVQFNNNFELIRTIESEKIDITTFNWNIKNSNISKDNTSKKIEQMFFASNFDLKKINTLFSNLGSLNIFELIQLRKNYKSLNYSLTEIDSHFNKIFSYPIYLTLITILTSIIMFNISYQKSSLFRIILGIFLSVIMYYISNFFNVLGTSEKIPLFLSIWLPLIILLIINFTFIIRINEK
jgi:lipopolysaccharide export system permease protein